MTEGATTVKPPVPAMVPVAAVEIVAEVVPLIAVIVVLLGMNVPVISAPTSVELKLPEGPVTVVVPLVVPSMMV